MQSTVKEHAELCWLLTCVTPLGWLERMTQFKDKSAKQETIGDGLLQYPVLMAADILLYQANLVPVGEDQSQHLELTRDIAQRFNALYGETFVMPETRLPTVGARIMGLDDPDKEDEQVRGRDQSRHRPARSTSGDPQEDHARHDGLQPAVDFELMGPGVQNLLTIHQAFTGWPDDEMKQHFAGMRYGDLKKTVAEAVVAGLEPLQKRYAEITGEPGYLDRLLEESADRVRPLAAETVRLVKERMGIYTA